jgi:hypothetical protein
MSLSMSVCQFSHEVGNPHDPESLLNNTVATKTLGITAAFDTIVTFVIPLMSPDVS